MTLYGLNISPSRGTGFVTVNGTQLTSSSDYFEWGTQAVNPILRKISFWLNSSINSGDTTIFITDNGVASNELPFRVNTQGRIVFVDPNGTAPGNGEFESPWVDPKTPLRADLQPGDVIYFRQGVYDKIYDGGNSNFYIRHGRFDTNKAPPTKELPVALVAYPGEVPYLLAEGSRSARDGKPQWNIDVYLPYVSIAGFKMYGRARNVIAAPLADGRGNVAEFMRVVDCDCSGLNEKTGGTGLIITHKSGSEIYGNNLYGSTTRNRLDHAVYLNGCHPKEGADVAWNIIHTMQVDTGDLISVNHFNNRCPFGQTMAGHRIRNNYLDCTNGGPSGGIGIFSMSYNVVAAAPTPTQPVSIDRSLEVAEPGTVEVHNNVILACGSDKSNGASQTQPIMYHNQGHAVFRSNVIRMGVYIGLSVGPPRHVAFRDINRLSTVVEDNVIQMNASRFTAGIRNEHDPGQVKTTIRRNRVCSGNAITLVPCP